MTFLAIVALWLLKLRCGRNKRDKYEQAWDLASMFAALRNQKCRVYPDVVIPDEARRVQYEYYERFGVKVPQTISLSSGQVPERESGCGRPCPDESVQAAG